MAFLNFLVGGARGTTLAMINTDGVEIRDIPIDLVSGESHILENQVTAHPVEDGAEISDHIRPLPNRVSLTGMFSDTPISVTDAVLRAQEGEPHTTRALTFFEEIRENRYLVDISNRFKSYSNMAVQSITFSRGVNNGKSVQFQVTFQEIRTVESEVLQGAAASSILTGISSPTQNLGKVSTSAPTEATSSASGSFLSRLTGLAG